MLRRPHFIAVSLVVLLVLVLLNLPQHTAAQIKLAISGLFIPLLGLKGSAQSASEKGTTLVLPRGTLVKDLERLRLENEQLKIRLQQYEEAAQENARLRKELGLKQQVNWKMKLAQVVGRDPSNWWRTLQIDLGSADGVRTNLAVLTAQGLVGRIGMVGKHRSQVILVGDPNCRVAANVMEANNTTRISGVIGPASSEVLDPTIVGLGYLSGTSRLQPGQRIVTSGQGGIFPRGIHVGQVIDLRASNYGSDSEARVKLWVDTSRVEEVWVLLP